MPDKKRTKAQERHLQDLFETLTGLYADFQHPELIPGILPPAWRSVDMHSVPEKTRITLRVDKDVAKFFRGFGPGYQVKMNEILRAFMCAYLSDTMGRIPSEVKLIPEEELSEDERHDLDMERRYVQMVKEVRERRARGPQLRRRWDDPKPDGPEQKPMYRVLDDDEDAFWK